MRGLGPRVGHRDGGSGQYPGADGDMDRTCSGWMWGSRRERVWGDATTAQPPLDSAELRA